MNDISIVAAIVVVIALGVALFLIFLFRGGRLKSFNLRVLKDAFDFSGTIDTKTDAEKAMTSFGGIETLDDESLARKIIQWLQQQTPFRIEGCYVLTDSTKENTQIAARLYSRIDGNIIGTCFFENPYYGRGDFASTISESAKFTRLATQDVCDTEDTIKVKDLFSTFSCKANFVMVPDGVEISKIGGIFCHLSDKSYLAFIALNTQDNSSNRGLVFSGTLAKELYTYFLGFVNKYSS